MVVEPVLLEKFPIGEERCGKPLGLSQRGNDKKRKEEVENGFHAGLSIREITQVLESNET